MSKYFSPLLKELTPYVPGEQPLIENLIKLNTNENPYPPSPKALQAIAAATNASLRLYPDPQSSALTAAIASYAGLSPENVFVGNSSDEVLALVFQAFFKQELPILFPDITYSFYPVYARMYEASFKLIPLNEKYEINLADYNQLNGGIIFPNPNAPTGIALNLDSIKQLLETNTDSVVVIDEAYVDFGAESAASLVNSYPNLVVTQTFSKSWALAGLRVGFALAAPELIEGLIRVKDSFNSYPLDRLAQAGAQAAIEDSAYMQAQSAKIMQQRTWLTEELNQLGFTSLPSQANFVFTSHAQVSASDLAAKLREKAILVRYFNQPRLENFLRITIGTEEDNQQLVKVLKEIL